MKYSEIKLHDSITKAIQKMGIEEMTEVQAKAIPEIHKGSDVTILSQTGSGKTLAFLVPMLDRILNADMELSELALLVIVPTRELGNQINDEISNLLQGTKYSSEVFYGGVSMEGQKNKLKKGLLAAVFTPGRLIDFIGRKFIHLETVKYLVIDEADRLFDMGFYEDIQYILKKVQKERQTVLASATLSAKVLDIAYGYLKDPVKIEIGQDNITVEGVEQVIYHLANDEKPRFLINYFKKENLDRVMIFVNTKFKVNDLEKLFSLNGFKARGISSLLSQKIRNHLIQDFRNGEFNILIATDVASRGLDIEGINHVINYDMPEYNENYVHRIGRTARAGRTGKAISFCSEFDYEILKKVEFFIDKKIESREVLAEYLTVVQEPVRQFQRKPGEYSRGRDQQRGRREERGYKRGNTSAPARSASHHQRDARSGRNDKRVHNKPGRSYEPAAHMHKMDSDEPVTVYRKGEHSKRNETGGQKRRHPNQNRNRQNHHRRYPDKPVNQVAQAEKTGLIANIKNFFTRFRKKKEANTGDSI